MSQFNSYQPIYLQLMDIIKQQIISGVLKKNDRVKSVRDYAFEYGINPNTVQKALRELERVNILRSESTSGRYVVLHDDATQQLRNDTVATQTKAFLSFMRGCGYGKDDILKLINDELKREDVNGE